MPATLCTRSREAGWSGNVDAPPGTVLSNAGFDEEFHGNWMWWAQNPRHRLAVDACENLYLLTTDKLWMVTNGEMQATPLVELPSELLYGWYATMFWGHEAGYSDAQTLYVTGYERENEVSGPPVRLAIHLGVDGNHVLSR